LRFVHSDYHRNAANAPSLSLSSNIRITKLCIISSLRILRVRETTNVLSVEEREEEQRRVHVVNSHNSYMHVVMYFGFADDAEHRWTRSLLYLSLSIVSSLWMPSLVCITFN